MRTQRSLSVLAILLTLAVGVSLLTSLSSDRSSVRAAPPLSLEGLLGDDEKLSDSTGTNEDLKADNFICLVCHGNFEEDELVVTHAKEDVGCADCHGKSEAHADDEDHVIPPDKMFDPEDVDKMCATCHDGEHDVPAVEVIARWQKRCPSKTDPDAVNCTDCHFEHRMRTRTVWWDRDTRRLIVREEGQTTKPADAAKPSP